MPKPTVLVDKTKEGGYFATTEKVMANPYFPSEYLTIDFKRFGYHSEVAKPGTSILHLEREPVLGYHNYLDTVDKGLQTFACLWNQWSETSLASGLGMNASTLKESSHLLNASKKFQHCRTVTSEDTQKSKET